MKQPQPQLPVLSVKLKMGLGDIIISHSQLWSIKNRYKKIYVSRRPGWEFQKEFMELIFTDPKFIIVEENKTQKFERQKFLHQFGNPLPDQKIFVPVLCTYDYSDIKNTYIVISTKVRGYRIDRWKELKPILIKNLLGLSKKYSIMLIGEKTIYEGKPEDPIYTIYDDLKNNLPIIDNTSDDLLPFSIDNIKKDCSLMHYAKKTICVGRGGNVILAYAVADCFSIVDSSFSNWQFHRLEDFNQIDVALKNL